MFLEVSTFQGLLSIQHYIFLTTLKVSLGLSTEHGNKLLLKAHRQELRSPKPQSSLIFTSSEEGLGLDLVTKIWMIYGFSMLTTKAGSKLKTRRETSHVQDHSTK